MIKHLGVFVLGLVLAAPALSNAQTASENLIRNHIVSEFRDFSRRAVVQSTKLGLADSDVDRAASEVSAAVADCLMLELEVMALTNNISKHTFMDALAFAIVWQTDTEFLKSLKGYEHLQNNARTCMESGFESQGVRPER